MNLRAQIPKLVFSFTVTANTYGTDYNRSTNDGTSHCRALWPARVRDNSLAGQDRSAKYSACGHQQVRMLGLMVTRGGRWVIHDWLRRHAALFEKLAVLDGSAAGSIDADWTRRQCALYTNIVYALESNISSTPLTDQTARHLAMQLLVRPGGGSADEQLIGKWVLNCHPDEYFVQDPREIIATVAMRDPRATCVLFGAAYVLPTRAEFEAIAMRHSDPSTGHETFSPMLALNFCDAAFTFKEPRLWKYVPGTRWGTRHSITTPEIHPGHRTWPTAREVILGLVPFFVHFKVHNFGSEDLTVVEGGLPGSANATSSASFARLGKRKRQKEKRSQSQSWVAFKNSGFGTGVAPHHTHGSLQVDPSRSAWDTILMYYELAGRPPAPLAPEIRRRCAKQVPRCKLPWKPEARFGALREESGF